MSENYDAFYSPGVEIKTETPSGSAEEFKPSAAKGKNGIYQAIVRFVPWWENPKYESIKEKWTCWLVDPVTENGQSVDCPSSVGKPSPLQDMYFKCKNSDNVLMQEKQSIFSRRKTFASLVQVIKDENNPENEGKILIWRYGIKIWEKINAELKPVIGDKHDPFDILEGKAFVVVVTKVSGYNNYDQSKFVDKKLPVAIKDAEGNMKHITPQTDQKAVFEYVKEHSPDLNKYNYREWTQDTIDYVNKVIVAVTGEAIAPQAAAGAINENKTGSGIGADTGITSSNISVEELGGDSNDPLAGLDLPSTDNLESGQDSQIGLGGDLNDMLKDL